MTVYVDDYRARFGRMTMCHMAADTIEELHTFGAAIGCRRSWFQGDHYDIPLFRRAKAVRLGAVEVTRREMVRLLRWRRRARCHDCGRPYGELADLVVPDDVWLKISPTGTQYGILCAPCIRRRAASIGIEIGEAQ
jgi:hypothetical protein